MIICTNVVVTQLWYFFSFHSEFLDVKVELWLQVLILSEKLHSVTAQFDQLRATRFQDIINRAMPRRKPKRITKEASPVNATLANPEPVEPDEIQAQPRRLQQQQLLDDETQALQVTRQQLYMVFKNIHEFCKTCVKS